MRHIIAILSIAALAAFAAEPTLEPVEYTVGRLSNGAPAFRDRILTFINLPEQLIGKAYFIADIDGEIPYKVLTPGPLFIFTPEKGSPISQDDALTELGFTRIDEIPKFFPLSNQNPIDGCRVWTKNVKPGETIYLTKWSFLCGFNPENQSHKQPQLAPGVKAALDAYDGPQDQLFPHDIAINKPDYVVYIPKQPRDRNKHNPALPGDHFNDHFHVLYKESNKTLFAFWTRASRECDIDQHIAFSKSTDLGNTWTTPTILAGSPNKKNPGLMASWQQPMISKSGRIYCLWNQQVTNFGPGGPLGGRMFGIFSDDDGETWSPPKLVPMNVRMDADNPNPLLPPCWCIWQRPLRLGQDNKYFVGLSRHGKAPYDARWGCKVEFLQYENIDDDPPVDRIKLSHFSTNKESLAADPKDCIGEPAVEEASIVKLPDGRLFAVMRSSVGSPVWSQSKDLGKTWSPIKKLVGHDGKPILHPRSPCPIYDWNGPTAASGTYFCLVHNTFNPNGKTAYQRRGQLFLLAGKFAPDADQPVQFAAPKLFAPRRDGNSFYTSYTVVEGKKILWFPDMKFYLLGRLIDESWF